MAMLWQCYGNLIEMSINGGTRDLEPLSYVSPAVSRLAGWPDQALLIGWLQVNQVAKKALDDLPRSCLKT